MKLRIKDTELSYQEAGRGEAVVLVHAFPLSRGLWAPTIRALSPRYLVLAPDLRGFGESDASLSTTLETYADDLATLLQERKLKRAVLVGCSMGGYISFVFAQKYRPLLRALVLVDTKPMADSPDAKLSRLENAQRVEQGQSAAFFEGMLARLAGATTLRERPGVVAAIRRMMQEASAAGVAAALRAMANRADMSYLLKTLDVPSLVIAGEEDQITPPGEARLWSGELPAAAFAVIPRAGHLPSIENPESFQRALREFLEKLP